MKIFRQKVKNKLKKKKNSFKKNRPSSIIRYLKSEIDNWNFWDITRKDGLENLMPTGPIEIGEAKQNGE